MKSKLTTRPVRAIWLAAPPALLCMLDAGLTLYGQSKGYWAGNYAEVNEFSPSFAQYLSIHPLAFVGANLLWILIFSVIVSLLPEVLALTVSIAIMIGHMGGAASWLAYHFHNYQACNGLFLVTAFIVAVSFKRGQSDDGASVIDWKRTGLPAWMRWALVAILSALPVWWFLVPH